MRAIFSALLVAGLCAGGSRLAALTVPRGEVQLFVDDSRIAESHGLQRTLRQPRKDNGGTFPVLSIPRLLDGPSTLQANGSIVYDPRLGRWVMFALACAQGVVLDQEDTWQRVTMVRFTSADGLNWQSDDPNGMQRIYPQAKQDLYDETAQATTGNYLAACTVYFDSTNAEWPYQGWIWLHKKKPGHSGEHFIRSKDGLRFEVGGQVLGYDQKKIVQDGRNLSGPGDTSRFAYDPVGKRFLAEIKFITKDLDPVTGTGLRSRTYVYFDRLDKPIDVQQITRVTLVPQNRQADGDFPSDEYYDTTAYRYGSLWLGELKIWHGQGNYPWSAAGSAFLKFMWSADGLEWHRVTFLNDDGIPEVFVRNGLEGGNGARNDGGYITPFSTPPLRIGDELIYYYGSSSYGKNHGLDKRVSGGGIFRARLRLDGFVSIDAGRLTTPPLQFEGDQLRVNSVGSVKVEAVDETGAVKGTAELQGDGVRQPVTFAGRSLREVASGAKSIALRFTVKPGSALYAFLVE